MPFIVTTGSQLRCSMGASPSVINGTLKPAVATTVACTVADFAPNVNIPSFGMCRSLANPQVAAATTAAQGVLTPQPCIPATATPWTPGSLTVKLNGVPALTNTSKCACTWLGVISVVKPGQIRAKSM
ncbi:MAG: hypothetical protein QOI39_3535 [Mycobacterium sp.]|jgi:hypothetical protein|nr:hypothetical protein [Mycobacterium sp.]